MRKALLGVAFFGCVLSTSDAHAQFANKSLGISPGFIWMFSPDVNWVIPVTLDGSFYAENGFDIFLHVPVGITANKARIPVGGPPPYITFAWGLQVGARYLFLEESVRPWAGIEATVMFVLDDPNPVIFYGGLGVTAGLDLFASDTFSVGPRVFFDGFLGVSGGVATWRAQLGGAFNLSVYF
jgi:outer membrane protein